MNQIRNRRARQSGVAAVELALILPILVFIIVITAYFGRLFWHYTVAMKAASDTAVLLATAPRSEIGVAKADLGEVDIVKFARSIAQEEISELNRGDNARPPVDIACDGYPCRGTSVPAQIGVLITLKVIDPVFAGYTGDFLEDGGITLHAEAKVQYVGN